MLLLFEPSSWIACWTDMDDILGKDTIKRLIEGGSLRTPDTVELHEWNGMPIPKDMAPLATKEALETWSARSEDIFVVTYPKAGTTWAQEIVSAIVNEGDIEKLNGSHSWNRVPFLECTWFHPTKDIDVAPTYKLLEQMKSPRTIKSHLPANQLPPDAWRKKSRVLYVARNPKDVAVSFYHFHNINAQLRSYDTWREFFVDFQKGNVPYGKWDDHFLSYWRKRNEPNVLFLKYEDMKMNLKETVLQVSAFLGYQLTDDVLRRVVDHCTFSNMRKNPASNPDFFLKDVRPDSSPSPLAASDGSPDDNETPTLEHVEQRQSFMRKGETGDWKNYFTVAENSMFDERIQEKLDGTGLFFKYE